MDAKESIASEAPHAPLPVPVGNTVNLMPVTQYQPPGPHYVMEPSQQQSRLLQMTSQRSRAFVGLGLALAVLGIAAILLNICANIWQAELSYLVGAGYWCGIMVSTAID